MCVSVIPRLACERRAKLDEVLVAEVTKDTRIKDVSFTSNTQYPKDASPERYVYISALTEDYPRSAVNKIYADELLYRRRRISNVFV